MLKRRYHDREMALAIAQLYNSAQRRRNIRFKSALFMAALIGSFLSLVLSVVVGIDDVWYGASLVALLVLCLWSDKIVHGWVLK